MRTLSKSKLFAYRQCPKLLWLEIHRSDLKQDSAATQTNFAVAYQVGISRASFKPPKAAASNV